MRLALAVLALLVAPVRARAEATCAERSEPQTGLVVERIPAAGGCLRVVRIDPARFALRLLTARAHGGGRTAPDWASTFGLTGVINASMYAPDERSIGMLVARDAVNRAGDNARLGAFLAFDPIDADAPPVVLAGRGCPGFDLPALRKRYRSIVQNYRMLDCDGKPVPWKDARRHTAAAVGLDPAGRVVLIHAPEPLLVSELAAALAAPPLALRAAMYVEGGREAVLWMRAGETAIGDGFLGGAVLSIPNVLGFAPR